MAKKNPYVMTIGFKKDDPDHLAVADFLNGIGHGKAQYIVKAVIAFQNFQQSGEAPITTSMGIDYRIIREMVFQVLEECKEKEFNSIAVEKRRDKTIEHEQDTLVDFDDDMLNGIMDSLSMFQGI